MKKDKSHYATRTPSYESRYFLFVGRESFVVEATGEVKPRTALASFLLSYSGSENPLICTNDASGIVKELDDVFKGHPTWTWRATPLRRLKRSASKPPESKSATSIRLNPLYCGFKRENGHSRNRYFHFVDTVQVTGTTSQGHYPALSEIESLIKFGTTYRDFCRDNGVPVTGQRGKFGGAMLRDPRFFDGDLRRIPAFINEAVREHLPGNHYELRAEVERTTQATYLDITNAHHEAAKRTVFPDPKGIRARGKRPERITGNPLDKLWASSGSRKYRTVLRTHGMVTLRCLYRGTSKNSLVHPAAHDATVNQPNIVHCFTNEIPLLLDSGFTIQGVEAAYTGARTTDALSKYAEHAIETLRNTPSEDKPWTKSLLLSTYGMLGKRPSTYQSVSNLGGKSFIWPTPSGFLEAQMKQTSKPYSPSTTNVIALGMIQAEVRRNVIELAKYLEEFGVDVLALYADSLIVSDSAPLPFLPPEWRVKSPLTNLRFFNPVSFTSEEEERLPGIGRDTTLRESRRRAIRARTRELGGEPASDWLEGLAATHGIGKRRTPAGSL